MDTGFYCKADPDHPGWMKWGPNRTGLFNDFVGPVHIRAIDEKCAEVRLGDTHGRLGNAMGGLHGGAMLGLLDVALFGGSTALGACEAAASVTVEVNTHFLAAGRTGVPLLVELEVMRSTRRLLFVRGVMRQGETALLHYNAIIRKGSSSR